MRPWKPIRIEKEPSRSEWEPVPLRIQPPPPEWLEEQERKRRQEQPKDEAPRGVWILDM